MLEHLNLDTMGKEELLVLRDIINHRLKGASLWDTVDALGAIDNQISKIKQKREKIEHSCDQLKKIKKLGFSLVIYEGYEKRIGFINHNIEKVDNKFYGFDIHGDEISNFSSNRQVLSDADIEAIEKIFEQKVRQS